MLRLPPTAIPLTRGEVARYETKIDRRCRVRTDTHLQEANIQHTLPALRGSAQVHLRKGPQRSVTYGSSPSPSASEVSTSPGESIESYVDDGRRQSRLRRDSTLSYESTGGRKLSAGTGFGDGLDGYGFEPSDGLLGLTLIDESQNRRRISHTRSVSDPYETKTAYGSSMSSEAYIDTNGVLRPHSRQLSLPEQRCIEEECSIIPVINDVAGHELSSAMIQCLRNTPSPLDEIIERTTRSPVIMRLPIRPDSLNVSSMRGGDLSRRTSDHREEYGIRSPQPRRRLAHPIITDSDRTVWSPGRSMPTEFTLPQVRPAPTNSRPMIRRRPLPSAEQENEEQEAPLYEQRRAWIARQMAPPTGRLVTTPSPDRLFSRGR